MPDKLKAFREPVAWVLLAAVAVQILGLIPALGLRAAVGGGGGAGVLVIAGTAVVLACAYWGERTPHARTLALVAAIEYAVLTLLVIILAVITAVVGNSLIGLSVLAGAVVPLIAAVGLYAVRDSLPAPARPRAMPGPPPNWGPPPPPRGHDGAADAAPWSRAPGMEPWQQPGTRQHPQRPEPSAQQPWQHSAPSARQPWQQSQASAQQPWPPQSAPQQPWPPQHEPQQPQPQSWPQDPWQQETSRQEPWQQDRPPQNPPHPQEPWRQDRAAAPLPWDQRTGSEAPTRPNPGLRQGQSADSGRTDSGADGIQADSPAWRPAPQPSPQRLQPQPGEAPVGPHTSAPPAQIAGEPPAPADPAAQDDTGAGFDDHGPHTPPGPHRR